MAPPDTSTFLSASGPIYPSRFTLVINHDSPRVIAYVSPLHYLQIHLHPCLSISPATLLTSLITLANNICSYNNNNSRFFPTQKRNVRETFRQVSILLIFLEEIEQSKLLAISDSVLTCFNELHVTFQKMKFLLDDCSHEGARLWILMKSNVIASQFRVLIRGINTALDVLPLDLVHVDCEVKEIVALLSKQASKVRVEVDSGDEYCANRVLLIVNYLEKGIEPDFAFVKQVIDYLKVKTWNECNKEVIFLEDMINFQCSNCEEKEVAFLSSLLGFMSYCRGVVFDTLRHPLIDDQVRIDARTEILTCLNPEDFRCPISLELMIDPVTVMTGQTYDRSSIEKWFKAGNMICPKTGGRLTNTELVPNSSLRKLIEQFCADNGISLAKSRTIARDITSTILPGSPAYASAIKFLSRYIARRLIFGTSEEKNKAAYEIRLVSKSNIFNRSCLIEAGVIIPLLNLLSSDDKSMQENTIAALLKLSKHATGKREIVEYGGIQAILSVLKNGHSPESKHIAAATIFYLSSVKKYQKLIGETSDAIPALVDLIKNGPHCGRKNAVVAIFSLLLYHDNRQRVIKANTIPVLINIISSSNKTELVADSLAVLATLAESFDGSLAILQVSGLPKIAGILQNSTSKAAKEYCVSILLSLCNNLGDEAITFLLKDRSLMSSLYLVITDGTSHGSKKARSLINLLQIFNETSTSRLKGAAVRDEHW
ncbi:hypothetical protein ACFE04_028947 [Oxalis oulophora]